MIISRFRANIGFLAILSSLLVLTTACTKYIEQKNKKGVIKSITGGTLEITTQDGYNIFIDDQYWGAVEEPKISQCVVISATIYKEDKSDGHYLPSMNAYMVPCPVICLLLSTNIIAIAIIFVITY